MANGFDRLRNMRAKADAVHMRYIEERYDDKWLRTPDDNYVQGSSVTFVFDFEMERACEIVRSCARALAAEDDGPAENKALHVVVVPKLSIQVTPRKNAKPDAVGKMRVKYGDPELCVVLEASENTSTRGVVAYAKSCGVKLV
jgi:hypothetical protein